jgi:hypothetical protein
MTTLATPLVHTDTQLRNDSLPAVTDAETAGPAALRPASAPVPLRTLATIALELAEQVDVWRPLLRVDPDRRWYSRLRTGDGWEAWLLTWLPGQGTDLHDHGGSSGAFTVLYGDLEERIPAPLRADPARMASHVLGEGQIRSFGARHIHQVTGVSTDVTASLHVYGPALTVMNRYELDPERGVVLAASERAGQDW